MTDRERERSRRDDDWEDDVAKNANDTSARERARSGGGSGNRISIAKRRYALNGEIVGTKESRGKEMTGIIVDFVYLNTYFKERFDADNPGAPSCWALSVNGDNMKPHDNIAKPEDDKCSECPMNKWGSQQGGSGRGKACAQRRRIGFLHEDDIKNAKDVKDALAAYVDLPPTSISAGKQDKGGPAEEDAWAPYVRMLDTKHGLPVWAAWTTMYFDPETSYPRPLFRFDGAIKDDRIVDAVEKRIKDVRDMLMTPLEDGSNGGGNNKRRSRDEEDDEKEDRSSRKRRDRDDDEDRPARSRNRAEDTDDDEKPSRRRNRDDEDDDDVRTTRRSSARGRDKDVDDDDRPRRSRRDVDDDDDNDKRRRSRDSDKEDDDKPTRKRASRDEDEEDTRRRPGRDEDEDDKPARRRSRDEDDKDEPRSKKRGSRFS